MNKTNRKYLIIGIVSILIVLIGTTLAYWLADIEGVGEDITVQVESLKIIFTDGETINEEISVGWTKTKEFTVENQSKTDYTYNINLINLVNTIVTDSLEYKITSEDDEAYKMDEFKPVQKCETSCYQVLGENITIKGNTTHTYQIIFRYKNLKYIDQSIDMGKQFTGKLSLTTSTPTLAEFFANKYKDATSREDFANVDEEGAVHKESGEYTEDINGDGIGEEVYYWTGNVNDTKYDNWVKFGTNAEDKDLWWRIIRTNEDGGLKLLYHGTDHTSTQAYINPLVNKGYIQYNSTYNNTMYVGYMYGTTGSLEKNRTSQKTSSTIKQTIDKWYEENLLQIYDKYISKTAIYCNDRSSDGYQSSGTMYYAANYRLYNKNHPTFKCGLNTTGNTPTLYVDATTEGGREKDMFTGKNTKGIGNQALEDKPVALMTADEVVYAGGLYSNNSKSYYYLNSSGSSSVQESWWWTMSPYYFDGSGAVVFDVSGTSTNPGYLNSTYVSNSSFVIRPVLSLKSCVTLTGDGTVDNPYIPHLSDECELKDN